MTLILGACGANNESDKKSSQASKTEKALKERRSGMNYHKGPRIDCIHQDSEGTEYRVILSYGDSRQELSVANFFAWEMTERGSSRLLTQLRNMSTDLSAENSISTFAKLTDANSNDEETEFSDPTTIKSVNVLETKTLENGEEIIIGGYKNSDLLLVDTDQQLMSFDFEKSTLTVNKAALPIEIPLPGIINGCKEIK